MIRSRTWWFVFLISTWASMCIARTNDPLSAKEREWIRQHGPIRYAPDPDFAPFEYYDSQGQLQGITPKLLELIASNLDIEIIDIRHRNWSEVLDRMKGGEIDFLGTLTKTEEREAYLAFSKPYLEVPFVIFIRKAMPGDITLEDIDPDKLGVVENVGAHGWLTANHPEIDPRLVQTSREGMLLLALGQLDGFVETLPVGAQALTDLSLNNIGIARETLSTEPQHLAVGLTNHILLSILQKGMDSIPHSERDRITRQWIGFDALARTSDKPWLIHSLTVLAIVSIALFFGIYFLQRLVRKRTRALDISEQHYRTLLENLPQMIFLKDRYSTYVSCNELYARMLGLKPGEIAGKSDFEFYPRELAEKYRRDDNEVMTSGTVREMDEDIEIKGERRIIHTVKSPVKDAQGIVQGVLGIFWDVTDQKAHETTRQRLEAQLRQSQKMEAVGRLAGGVAHDFNNILTIILGNTNLLDSSKDISEDGHKLLHEVSQAALRAAGLTRQLLTFSRRQPIEMVPVDMNVVIRRMRPILDPLARDRIHLHFDLSTDLSPVAADVNMMEQIVLNLVINARDALPDGGHVWIRTGMRRISAASMPDNLKNRTGDFMMLEVEDDGHGMDEVVKAHIFEPFFTTKSIGQGTGLGLASVYGIVEQHNGWIDVKSQPGQGARFRIYIPAKIDLPVPEQASTGVRKITGGTETILLVEDEDSLRRMACIALRRQGYTVYESCSGDDALDLIERESPRIDILLTDVAMPGETGGIELAIQLQARWPGLKVILSSGYSEEVFTGREVQLPRNAVFLPKPYEISTLTSTIRSALTTKGN